MRRLIFQHSLRLNNFLALEKKRNSVYFVLSRHITTFSIFYSSIFWPNVIYNVKILVISVFDFLPQHRVFQRMQFHMPLHIRSAPVLFIRKNFIANPAGNCFSRRILDEVIPNRSSLAIWNKYTEWWMCSRKEAARTRECEEVYQNSNIYYDIYWSKTIYAFGLWLWKPVSLITPFGSIVIRA